MFTVIQIFWADFHIITGNVLQKLAFLKTNKGLTKTDPLQVQAIAFSNYSIQLQCKGISMKDTPFVVGVLEGAYNVTLWLKSQRWYWPIYTAVDG